MSSGWVSRLGVAFLFGVAGGRSGVAATVPFAEPPTIASVNGVLDATLTVAPSTIEIAGRTLTTTVYDGRYVPPVLRVSPGDTMRIRLVDASADPTNLHTHGLAVSPLGNGDNVFLTVPGDGGMLDYEIPIPADHPQGLFWYHPHFHPGVNAAIAGGLSGALVVGDVLAPFPELRGITERLILLKDMKIRGGAPVVDPDPSGRTLRTVNGLYKPRIEIAPGEVQLWRIANIGANIYYDLRMDGVAFHVLAQDGNTRTRPEVTKRLIVPPGARYEVLVQGPRRGRYRLRTRRFSTGPAGDHYPGQVLATLVSAGMRVAPRTLPASYPSQPDLREIPNRTPRTVVFQDTDDPNVFQIDGKTFDHDRVDATVALGSVEEWTVLNTSKELHVFHIHQVDVQLIEVDGEPVPFQGYQDTVSLPIARGKDRPGSVKLIIPFTNPIIQGRFVYHCHIVQHADQGMMASILVRPEPSSRSEAQGGP